MKKLIIIIMMKCKKLMLIKIKCLTSRYKIYIRFPSPIGEGAQLGG